MERVKGIEPSSSAWKAVALPLSYTRIGNRRALSERCQAPPVKSGLRIGLVGEVGLEPTKAKPADLQSAPFAARDTPPVARVLKALQRAGQVRLCRFHYHSEQFSGRHSERPPRGVRQGCAIAHHAVAANAEYLEATGD